MYGLILFKPSPMTNQLYMKLSDAEINILLVEDSELKIKYTSFMLKSTVCLVSIAQNGKEAIENYQSNHKSIDLIMLDTEMPIMDGYQTLKILKEEFKNKLCFVCAFSTLVNNENYTSFGFNSFISKAPRNNEIIKLLQQVKNFKQQHIN